MKLLTQTQIEALVEEIREQFDSNEKNIRDEPVAWLEFDNGRCMEIVEEHPSILKDKWEYSCVIYCSETERKMGIFSEQKGIIDKFTSGNVTTRALEVMLRLAYRKLYFDAEEF